jgi:hypothetical protein
MGRMISQPARLGQRLCCLLYSPLRPSLLVLWILVSEKIILLCNSVNKGVWVLSGLREPLCVKFFSSFSHRFTTLTPRRRAKIISVQENQAEEVFCVSGEIRWVESEPIKGRVERSSDHQDIHSE